MRSFVSNDGLWTHKFNGTLWFIFEGKSIAAIDCIFTVRETKVENEYELFADISFVSPKDMNHFDRTKEHKYKQYLPTLVIRTETKLKLKDLAVVAHDAFADQWNTHMNQLKEIIPTWASYLFEILGTRTPGNYLLVDARTTMGRYVVPIHHDIPTAFKFIKTYVSLAKQNDRKDKRESVELTN